MKITKYLLIVAMTLTSFSAFSDEEGPEIVVKGFAPKIERRFDPYSTGYGSNEWKTNTPDFDAESQDEGEKTFAAILACEGNASCVENQGFVVKATDKETGSPLTRDQISEAMKSALGASDSIQGFSDALDSLGVDLNTSVQRCRCFRR